MTLTRLYAFTDDAGRAVFEAFAAQEPFRDLSIVSHNRLHAITGPEPTPWPWQDRNHFTALRLLHYHRMLGEAVRHFTKIIPASFESVFDYPEAVMDVLNRHPRDIRELLMRYGHLRQFGLNVRWDVSVMQQLLRKFPKIASDASLEKERRTLRDQILLHLQGNLRDIIILNDGENETVLQTILLIDARAEEKLASVLEAVDNECQGRLQMRLVGPLPACNFARVEVKLPDSSLVRQARQDLGIGFSERLSEVKNAYRRKIKALPPEDGTPEIMTRLTRSYRYLTRLAAQQNADGTIDPDKQWLHCDPKTLRRTPLLHIQRGITHWDNDVIGRN